MGNFYIFSDAGNVIKAKFYGILWNRKETLEEVEELNFCLQSSRESSKVRRSKDDFSLAKLNQLKGFESFEKLRDGK